jgi:hypothetical protein
MRNELELPCRREQRAKKLRAGPFDTDADENDLDQKWWTVCGRYDLRAAWLGIAK